MSYLLHSPKRYNQSTLKIYEPKHFIDTYIYTLYLRYITSNRFAEFRVVDIVYGL